MSENWRFSEIEAYLDGKDPVIRHPSTLVAFGCFVCPAVWWQRLQAVLDPEQEHSCPNCKETGKIVGHIYDRMEAYAWNELEAELSEEA